MNGRRRSDLEEHAGGGQPGRPCDSVHVLLHLRPVAVLPGGQFMVRFEVDDRR